jgi:2-oxo-4-hydroxy-4-carboxy-5-ureidoimidazoline decarboxylase
VRVSCSFDHCGVLLHQGIGLDEFNALPQRRAVHALFECSNSVTLARDLANGRPYADHDALFRRADALLFELAEECLDLILEACPHIGRRPRSARSRAEQCAVWDDDCATMTALWAAAERYTRQFGFGFVMYVGGLGATEVLTAIEDRLHHNMETERKVVRNELARINRTRLERMLGPEGGYQNW